MNKKEFSLITLGINVKTNIPIDEMEEDHNLILEDYLSKHWKQNHTGDTAEYDRRFLIKWFQERKVADESHPNGERQLFIWELMSLLRGREIVKKYVEELENAKLRPRTRRKKLGALRRLCEYVMVRPIIPGEVPQLISEKYGPIELPITKYDYPMHVADDLPAGRVLTEKQKHEFLMFLFDLVEQNPDDIELARDVAMVTYAIESNLRAREIRMSDVAGPHRALLYEDCSIYTAYGKGFRGSGPLARFTVFTPLAQATLRPYEEKVRPRFPGADNELALFLSIRGGRIAYRTMRRRLKRLVKLARAAGLDIPENLTWHSFRRTFATLSLENDPHSTAKLVSRMGHRSFSTLPRYVIHNSDYIKRKNRCLHDRLLPKWRRNA